MTTTRTETSYPQAAIEADPKVPLIRITRDFHATPAQLFRAHTDPALFARWVGPSNRPAKIDHWDAREGGSWRFGDSGCEDGLTDKAPEWFRGCFHTVREDRIVQTFTWEGMPDDVSLQTMTFVELGDGRTRLVAESLCSSFEARDGWLASGMETGVTEGYAALDQLLAGGDA